MSEETKKIDLGSISAARYISLEGEEGNYHVNFKNFMGDD